MADNTQTDQQERWRMVVVPLFVVATVGMIAVGVTMMRRRYGLNGPFGPYGGPQDARYTRGNNNNDGLDPSYYYSYRHRSGAGMAPVSGRRRRDNQHYANPHHDGNADLEGGRATQHGGDYYGSRPGNEGLNEFGEAPPPYVGSGEGKKGGAPGAAAGPAAETGTGVEMSPLGQQGQGTTTATAAAAAAADVPPPQGPPPAAAAPSSPPAYSEGTAMSGRRG